MFRLLQSHRSVHTSSKILTSPLFLVSITLLPSRIKCVMCRHWTMLYRSGLLLCIPLSPTPGTTPQTVADGYSLDICSQHGDPRARPPPLQPTAAPPPACSMPVLSSSPCQPATAPTHQPATPPCHSTAGPRQPKKSDTYRRPARRLVEGDGGNVCEITVVQSVVNEMFGTHACHM